MSELAVIAVTSSQGYQAMTRMAPRQRIPELQGEIWFEFPKQNVVSEKVVLLERRAPAHVARHMTLGCVTKAALMSGIMQPRYRQPLLHSFLITPLRVE